eukprot:TRINITY_DN3237_c0_g1_i2.p1 TRINITY_DN3237_c0_g1~~TRINITY_DN3237_c0_g1_i2.p1  ORF type:complete len:871 (+),score=173.60 TRINITY_DN3237_c0_g1_i2:50-2662(+)
MTSITLESNVSNSDFQMLRASPYFATLMRMETILIAIDKAPHRIAANPTLKSTQSHLSTHTKPRTALQSSDAESEYERSVQSLVQQWPIHGKGTAPSIDAAALATARMLWMLADFGSLRAIVALRKRCERMNLNVGDAVRRLKSSPLHRVVEADGKRELLRELLSWGIPVDETGTAAEKQTPLHVAVFMDRDDLVLDLLSAGASLSKVDFQMSTPLHIATGNSRTGAQVVQILLENIVARQDKSALLDARDKDGDTPLHLVTLRGGSNPKEIMKLLLDIGASPNIQNKKMETPLHMSIRQEELVLLLLEYNADPNAQDHRGRTPLHDCVYGIHASSLLSAALMSKGGNPFISDETGKTPLDLAQGSRISRTLLVDEETTKAFQAVAQSLRRNRQKPSLLKQARGGTRSRSSDGSTNEQNENDAEQINVEKRQTIESTNVKDGSIKELLARLRHLKRHNPSSVSEQLQLCNQIGLLYSEQGMYRNALRFHTQELELAVQEVDKISAHQNMGYSYRSLGMFQECFQNFQTCLDIASLIDDPLSKQRAYSALAGAHIDYATINADIDPVEYESSLRKAELYSDKSLESIATLRRRPGMARECDSMEARSLINIAMVLNERKKYDEALARLLSAIQLAETIKDNLALESGYAELGNLHLQLSQYENALIYFEKLLHIAKKSGNPWSLSNSHLNLGSVHLELKKYQKAMEFFERARYHAAQVDDQGGMLSRAQVAFNSARLFIEITLEIQTIKHFSQKSSDDQTDVVEGKSTDLAELHKQLACLLEDRGKLSDACIEFQKALDLNRGADPLFSLSCLSGLGACTNALGKHDLALQHYKKQLEIAQRISNAEEQASALCCIAGVYQQQLGASDKKV